MRYHEVNTWPEVNDGNIYIKYACADPYLKKYKGEVLAGCFFTPKFSLKAIANFTPAQKEANPDAENIWQFFHGGYFTFNLADIVYLSGEQVRAYKSKMMHGDDLNLHEKENCWLDWDPFIKKIWIDEPREKERQRLLQVVE